MVIFWAKTKSNKKTTVINFWKFWATFNLSLVTLVTRTKKNNSSHYYLGSTAVGRQYFFK